MSPQRQIEAPKGIYTNVQNSLSLLCRFPQTLNVFALQAVALLCFFTYQKTHPNQTTMSSESYIFQDASPESSNDHDDVDSLPSSMDSSDFDSVDESDAQKEWEASLQQLELILTMVIVPYAGKYFGRKFAYWSELRCWPSSFHGY